MNKFKIIKSRELWKDKAIKKGKEARILRKEKKQLQQSRNLWKAKYKQLQANKSRYSSLKSSDISRHSYNSVIIVLCLYLKLYAQQSVRGISKSIKIWMVTLGLECKTPSHTTIHTWLRKSGYYRLSHSQNNPDAQWVLFIDESVCMGREKLLLVMGVDIRTVHQGNLSFANSSCLYLSSKNSWKGENIAEELALVREQLHGKIRFAVTGRGNNIRKALKLADIPYIHDLTHEMALYLGQIYRNAEDFKAYTKWTALLRRQLVLSPQAHVMPPEQRSKARFHNIEPLYKWGKAVEEKMENWQQQDKCLYEKFKNISRFKGLLQELALLLKVIKQIKKWIVQRGLRRDMLPDIYQLLSTLKSGRPAKFAKKMSLYFQECLFKLNKQNIPVCCSDLIESAFGKYKLMMSENQWSGITDLALVIPSFMGNRWDSKQIKNAFQQVKAKDYKEWSRHNMEDSLLKKRSEVFQKVEYK